MRDNITLEYNDLAASLKRIREARGLGTRELARAAGVPPSTVTRIEQGENPRLDSIVRLAKTLQVSLDALVLPRIDGPIGDAYARYDSDPRVNGPDDFDAFADAIEPLLRDDS